MNKDITFIIQGKLNKVSLQNLHCYLSYGNVIISCWVGDDKSLLTNLDKNIKICFQEYPPNIFYNEQNLLYHCLTTLNGLDNCKTKFVIKVRSDEFYTNFEEFIEKIFKYPEKIITNNVFFRPNHLYKFHPSDHVIGGKPENLKLMFQTVYEKIINKQIEFPAEVFLCKSYLVSKNVKIIDNKSSSIMKKYFDIVHLKKMGKFQITYNSKNKIYNDADVFFNENECIHSMNELQDKTQNLNEIKYRPIIVPYKHQENGIYF